MTQDVIADLARIRIVPVVVIDDAAAAAPLAEVLASGGLRCAEITLRTPAAMDAIAALADYPELLVGAGTVLDAEQAARAVGAGARFVVSPGFDGEVVEACRRLGVPVLPGTATPTEIQQAMRAGLAAVKFFPAETLGGVQALSAMAAPFPGFSFVPTGGITPVNVQPYLQHPSVLAVGGSWMAPRKLIASKAWGEIAELAAGAARLAADNPAPESAGGVR